MQVHLRPNRPWGLNNKTNIRATKAMESRGSINASGDEMCIRDRFCPTARRARPSQDLTSRLSNHIPSSMQRATTIKYSGFVRVWPKTDGYRIPPIPKAPPKN